MLEDFFCEGDKILLILLAVSFIIILLQAFWIGSFEHNLYKLKGNSIKAFDEAERRISSLETSIKIIKACSTLPKKRGK